MTTMCNTIMIINIYDCDSYMYDYAVILKQEYVEYSNYILYESIFDSDLGVEKDTIPDGGRMLSRRRFHRGRQ